MLFLLRHGIERKTAYTIAEMVRRGKAGTSIKKEEENLLLGHGVPDWYIGSMKKVMYLFPAAHAAEFVTEYLRLSWYRIHRKEVFREVTGG